MSKYSPAMRGILLFLCITHNQVCTYPGVGLLVVWTAPEPEGNCIQNNRMSLPHDTAITWSGPPRKCAGHEMANILSSTLTGNVTLRARRPLTDRRQGIFKQLQMQPVDPASCTQQLMDLTANSSRPGTLLLASLGDSKTPPRQHPAITGFSASHSPMVVHTVQMLEMAEFSRTQTEACIAQGLTKTVQTATCITGQLAARRPDSMTRSVWVDPQGPHNRV